jgi:hypothetical protein
MLLMFKVQKRKKYEKSLCLWVKKNYTYKKSKRISPTNLESIKQFNPKNQNIIHKIH